MHADAKRQTDTHSHRQHSSCIDCTSSGLHGHQWATNHPWAHSCPAARPPGSQAPCQPSISPARWVTNTRCWMQVWDPGPHPRKAIKLGVWMCHLWGLIFGDASGECRLPKEAGLRTDGARAPLPLSAAVAVV